VLRTILPIELMALKIRKVAKIRYLSIWPRITASRGVPARPGRIQCLEISKGIISTAFAKDPTDPQWQTDPAYKAWVAFMDKYYPNGDQTLRLRDPLIFRGTAQEKNQKCGKFFRKESEGPIKRARAGGVREKVEYRLDE
jgi:hypothetical protein